jgi:hypothetical protein
MTVSSANPDHAELERLVKQQAETGGQHGTKAAYSLVSAATGAGAMMLTVGKYVR